MLVIGLAVMAGQVPGTARQAAGQDLTASAEAKAETRGRTFRRVVLREARAAGIRGKQLRELSFVLVFPRHRAMMERMVFAEGQDAKAIGNGEVLAAIDWEKFAAWIKEVLPIIIEAILTIINAFGIEDGMAGGGPPAIDNENTRAANVLVVNTRTRLANGFAKAKFQFAQGTLTKTQLNEELARVLTQSYAASRAEFETYSGKKFKGADTATVQKVLQDYIGGFDR